LKKIPKRTEFLSGRDRIAKDFEEQGESRRRKLGFDADAKEIRRRKGGRKTKKRRDAERNGRRAVASKTPKGALGLFSPRAAVRAGRFDVV